ncbi:MAG TPA: condensation domain-containing protein, partial [Thermoanaerobaculia bacterium]
SILGLQVVARAKRRGLEITPRQVFSAPTVAELAALAADATPGQPVAARRPAPGPVPLTPIQAWFFSRPVPDRHHWNQAVLLQVAEALDPSVLAAALAVLLAHHEALSLRFTEEHAGWQASYAPAAGPPPASVVDLSALPPELAGAALRRIAPGVQASLDLHRGPLLRAVLLRWPAGGADRLLLVAHHLVMDAVSWRILLEDLEDAVQQLAAGRTCILPSPSTSFPEWARRLSLHAAAPELAAELSYWLAAARRLPTPLPLDGDGGANLAGGARSLHTRLGEAETRDLLQEAPKNLHADLLQLLLCALARAFATWTGSPRLLVDLEGHGREPLWSDVDLSRTVGWFTSLFPLLLELPPDGDELAALRRVKEQAQGCPGHGLGYGQLRFLPGAPPAGRDLAALPQAEVKLLYLGQMDRALPAATRFSEAPEDVGPTVSPCAPRSHLLDVTARVYGGELHVAWTYGERLHDRRTISNLAAALLDELRTLARRARAPAPDVYTPGDFPQAGLDAEELGDLMAQLQAGEGD